MAKSEQPSVREAVEWYRDKRDKYQSLCDLVKTLIEQLLKRNSVNYHSITCRAKDVDSFEKKCRKDKYSSPKDEITDMAGIRIITYLDSDVERIGSIIEREFLIDEANSINKSKRLDVNQVGYRSVHYIAKLPEKRIMLSEYEDYKDMTFEIQIRTILQHAWAEIEHDRNYKFNGVLPPEIKRRFYLAAGALELIDREFEALSRDIDKYAKQVEQQTKKGELDIEINSTSIMEYLSNKFDHEAIDKTLNGGDQIVINELEKMGVRTLAQLDSIIPESLLENIVRYKSGRVNFLGVLRNIMIIHDPSRYFEEAWQHHWDIISHNEIVLYSAYGIPIREIMNCYGIY